MACSGSNSDKDSLSLSSECFWGVGQVARQPGGIIRPDAADVRRYIQMAPNNQNGGGRGPRGHGPFGGPRNQRGLEELLKRGQDKLRQAMPGGSGLSGTLIFLVAVVLAAIVGFYAFTFRVSPDELGVVLYLGAPSRQEPPGLHFRLPYPIEEVYLPKVTRQNIIEIGMRTDGRNVRGVPEESLMLTGDENIVEIYFVVFWRIKDAQKYLFNIKNPDITVKDVAQSAMRDVVGQSNIQPLLTGARQKTEQSVQKLMQDVLDIYEAGVRIDEVRLQKVDPPAQVMMPSATCRLLAPTRSVYRTRPGPTPIAFSRRRGATSSAFCRPRAATSNRRWPRRKARAPVSSRFLRNTRRHPTSRASACIWRPWSASSAARTRSSSTARSARAWCHTFRLIS